jgi:hypothetical protein
MSSSKQLLAIEIARLISPIWCGGSCPDANNVLTYKLTHLANYPKLIKKAILACLIKVVQLGPTVVEKNNN